MEQSIVAFIAGAIVVWSVVIRFQTINSPEFTENSRVTIGIFSIFAVGLLLLDPHKGDETHTLLKGHWLYLIFMISPLFLPTIYRVLHGFVLASAIDFRWFKSLFYTLLSRIILVSVLLIIGASLFDSFGYDLRNSVHDIVFWLVPSFWFLSFALLLGFIHSIFGSVIAGINIALVITHFFYTGGLAVDLGTVFDIFERFGVSSMPLKWAVLLVSTALGLHSCMTLNDLKDMVRDWLSP